MIWNVSYGSEKREQFIRAHAKIDPSGGVMYSAMHFEWTLKRAIKKLGKSPTRLLGEELEKIYSFSNDKNGRNYKAIWDREISKHHKRSALGTILGNLPTIKNVAMTTRGKVAHGNGPITDAEAEQAIDLYLNACRKIRDFVKQKGEDVDTKLKARLDPKSTVTNQRRF